MGSAKKKTTAGKGSVEGQVELGTQRLAKLRSAEQTDTAAVRFAHKKLKRAQRALAKQKRRLAKDQKDAKAS